MENDIRFKITNYFELSLKERDILIGELVSFYYQKWINIDSKEKFEHTINELLFRIEMEYQFALKSEEYERVEIYQKLAIIFNKIKEKYNDIGL